MGRRFVDGIWIQQRMREKNARREAEARRRWPRQLQPEIVPFVDVEIVRAPDAQRGPVVDIMLVPKGEGVR